MSGLVIVTRGATCAKRGCERRGTHSHPHCASGGTALSFLGYAGFELLQKTLRRFAQGFQDFRPFVDRFDTDQRNGRLLSCVTRSRTGTS